MLTLLASLFGVLGSIVPDVVGFFKKAQDHKQEIALMRLSAEISQNELALKAEMAMQQAIGDRNVAVVKHDTATARNVPVWVDCIRSLVRPVLTFGILAVYAGTLFWAPPTMLETSAFVGLETMTAAVWAFWFGERTKNSIKRGGK